MFAALIGIGVFFDANRGRNPEQPALAIQATGNSTISDDQVTQDGSTDEVKSCCISIGGYDDAGPKSAETYVREMSVLLRRIQNEGGPGNVLALVSDAGGIEVLGAPGDEWVFLPLAWQIDEDTLSDEMRQYIRKAVSCGWDLSEPGSRMHLSIYKLLQYKTDADRQSAAIFLLKTFGVLYGLQQGEEILAELRLEEERQRDSASISNRELVNEMMLARPPAPVESAGGREPIPAHVRREVWRRDQGKCVKCGSRERLEFDHIIPVSQGGSNTARNIELLCEKCNRAKGAKIE